MRLIAKTQITYGNREYERGQELPKDAALATRWVEAGTAYWKDDEAETKKKVKAKAVTAPAGVTGLAQPATSVAEPDLVGKVPSPKARGVVKDKSKRAPKKKG